MTRCTLDQLGGYLENYGWCFEETSVRSLNTGWQSEDREFPLSVEINESTISFEVRPLLSLDLEWYHWPEISTFLLELNHKSQLVKLSLSEEGEIVLSAFGLVNGFNYEHMANILGILGYYCDAFYDEIIQQLSEFGFQNHKHPEFLT